jgi:uncharacterized protein YcfJ
MKFLLGTIGLAHARRVLLAAAVVTTALTAPTAALASEGAATPFKATYTAPAPVGVSNWTCSGAHVVNRVSVKDSETCLISGNTVGFVAGTYVGNPNANVPPFGVTGWFSDYNGAVATSFTATIVNNGDGTFTQYLTAYYA